VTKAAEKKLLETLEALRAEVAELKRNVAEKTVETHMHFHDHSPRYPIYPLTNPYAPVYPQPWVTWCGDSSVGEFSNSAPTPITYTSIGGIQ